MGNKFQEIEESVQDRVGLKPKRATMEGLVNGNGTNLQGCGRRLRDIHTVIVQLLQLVIFRVRIVRTVSL